MATPISRRDAIKLAVAGSALASPNLTFSSDTSKVLDVVFEGGGIKGAAFCGALKVLETQGYSYRHLIGTSAGAITAALLAAGYSSGEMQAILTQRNAEGQHVFSTFLLPPTMDSPAMPRNASFLDRIKSKASAALGLATDGLFGSAKRVATEIADKARHATGETKLQWSRMLALMSTGAFASDSNFLAWLCTQLQASPRLSARLKTAEEARNLTLQDFHEQTRGSGVQLSVVAADVTGMRVLVLNHHSAPTVPVVDAVRMSMGIPIVWPEVAWKKEWGTVYDGTKMWDEKDGGNLVVDGGVLSNFPLRYLINPSYMTDQGILGRPSRDVPTKILGLLLDESLPIPGVDPGEDKKHLAEKLPAYRSLSRILNAMFGAIDQEAIDDSRRAEVVARSLGAEGPLCRIPVKGYQTLDFEMDEDRMKILIESGRGALEKHLQRPA